MTCSRSLPPSSHVEVEEIKKGLKSPCFAHRRVSRVDSSTPGDAPSYENDNRELSHDLRLSRCSFLLRPSCLMPPYKHCGNAGQGKCGRNLAHAGTRRFKHAFEIEAAVNTTDVNRRRLPQRGREFAPEQPAIRRRGLIS
jgi:hypothetical protein